MGKKQRIGLQVRFNSESEQDIIDFFSTLKKSEVHITVISAFRMYIRAVGFYDSRWLESGNSPHMLKQGETCSSKSSNKIACVENEGLVDEETFRAFDGMFDSENEF